MPNLTDVDVRPYEGLVRASSQRFAGMTGLEDDDLQQVLRLKVAQALAAWDPGRRRTLREVGEAERRWVFMCVRNKLKDLVRDEHARKRRAEIYPSAAVPLYMEDIAAAEGSDHFEHSVGMSVAAEAVFGEGDTFQLPSTLTKREADVLLLMVLDFNNREIALRLGMTKGGVRKAHANIQLKMQDWRPPPRLQPDRVAA